MTFDAIPSVPSNNKIAGIITALASLVSAVGIAVTIYINAQHSILLKQVERQGNSVALEQKRVTAAALRSLAAITKKPEDELKAKDAEDVYEQARQQAALAK